ncbi:MAG: Zn-binding domain-containing protein, partial [Candidatus Eremiobacterota bacterium]
VLAGYPGTVASTWQQAGRVGRRSESSAVVLVGKSDPLDQFLMQNPDYFFGASPEHARINPDNPAILVSHLKCAAFELPIGLGEKFGNAEVGEVLEFLAERQVLHLSGGQYHWTQEAYPADAVSLRSASPENFCIMDVTDRNRVIAEVDWHSAPSTVYQDAIYMVQARTFQVKQLDYPQRRAYVKPVEVDYYTDAITATRVRILDGFERTPVGESAAEHGEVHVTWRVSGFKKIKFYSRENVGYGEVNLPDHEMHTTAFWLTLSHEMLASLGYARADLLDGVVGLAYCLHHLAPVYLMCDLRDLDRCVGDRAATWFARSDRDSKGRYTFASADEPMENSESWMRIGMDPLEPSLTLEGMERFEPTLFLYDNYPGGMGFSAQLYDQRLELLTVARERLRACECLEGCPSCVGPPNEVGTRSREVALAALQALLEPAPRALAGVG